MMVSDRRRDAGLIALTLAGALPVTLAELTSDLEQSGLAYVFFLVLACAGGAALAWPSSGVSGGTRWVVTRTIVLTGLAYAALELSVSRQVPVIALGHFVIILCAAKFLDLHTDDDRMVVVIITLLLMVIGAMVSGSVVFGLVLLLHLTAGVHWLVHFRLASEAQAVWSTTLARIAPTQRRPAPQLSGPGSPAPALWPVSLSYGAVLLGVVVLIFLLVPRDLIHTRIRLGVPAGMAGFSAPLNLRELNPILESDQPVMRVRQNRNGQLLGGDDRAIYLRGVTYDLVSRGRWLRLSTQLFEVHGGGEPGFRILPFRNGVVRSQDRLETEIWLEHVSDEEPYLFTVYPAVAFASPDVDSMKIDPGDRSLQMDRAPKSTVYYRVVSPAELDRGTLQSIESAASQPAFEEASAEPPIARYFRPGRGPRRLNRERSVQPDLSPAVLALAQRVAGASKPPLAEKDHAAATEKIAGHLRSALFRYTLSPRPLRNAGSPIEAFLFDTREGYCTHFASAMTMMCQSLGIKARLVMGYLATEYNSVGQFYRVRKRDAHAWVEVKLPGRDWVVFDPTPLAADETRHARNAWLATIGRWYDYLQFRWASVVVTFDSEHRRELLAALARWWRQPLGQVPGGGTRFQALKALLFGPPEFTTAQRCLYWLCITLVSTLVLLVLRALWVVSLIIREHLPRRRRGAVSTRDPAARFYDRLLVLLARRGFVKSPALTPLEFADRLVADRPDFAPVRRITDWFYQAQYGRQPLPPETRQTISLWLGNLRHYGRFGPVPAAENGQLDQKK